MPIQASSGAQMLTELHKFHKPVVAAVSGLAVGVGTILLLHCDLVYAAPETRFCTPFVNLGTCPEAGSSLLLPAMEGHRRNAEVLMLGDFFSTDKAIELGFVNAAIATEKLLDHALKLPDYPFISAD